MEIESIDKQIAQYLEKLNNKEFRRVRKGKKRAGLPGHLRRFYLEEISKLEKQKEKILNQKDIIKSVFWEDVYFEDFYIRVNINGLSLEPFQLPNSRKCFEFIKPLIFKNKLEPLIIKSHGSKIIEVQNFNYLNQIVEIISFQKEIHDLFQEFTIDKFHKAFYNSRSLNNSIMFSFFNLQEKNEYFKHLCNLQSEDFKVIPVIETLSYNHTNSSNEDTFIFTSVNTNHIFLIWESSSCNRATYVFCTDKVNYQNHIQNILAYIISEEKRKRSKLRKSFKTNNILQGKAIIHHNDFESWKSQLNKLTRFNE